MVTLDAARETAGGGDERAKQSARGKKAGKIKEQVEEETLHPLFVTWYYFQNLVGFIFPFIPRDSFPGKLLLPFALWPRLLFPVKETLFKEKKIYKSKVRALGVKFRAKGWFGCRTRGRSTEWPSDDDLREGGLPLTHEIVTGRPREIRGWFRNEAKGQRGRLIAVGEAVAVKAAG